MFVIYAANILYMHKISNKKWDFRYIFWVLELGGKTLHLFWGLYDYRLELSLVVSSFASTGVDHDLIHWWYKIIQNMKKSWQTIYGAISNWELLKLVSKMVVAIREWHIPALKIIDKIANYCNKLTNHKISSLFFNNLSWPPHSSFEDT